MLQLKDIRKLYGEKGKEQVEALKGISLEFREKEFVSILGPSGCGKTTFLNIIGGLDKYSSGDLVINGKSTKEFKDRDWDTYRNHSIGFVFQGYNLISHQSILNNVELALTLAGIGRKERRKRAIKALEEVGLKDKIHKKPTELSGGQMQRVAIARALVGNPDILLADEPTGALDSATSVQIMDLLKEVAKDRLVIMVTHNGELAEKYSTRIIKLLDGNVIGDSNPYSASNEDVDNAKNNAKKTKRTKLKFTTALSLSFRNLLTKKGRTILTSFAGSIGIIGIALILSLSNGMQEYINKIQTETMAGYPLQIESTTIDLTSMMMSTSQTDSGFTSGKSSDEPSKEGTILSKDDVTNNIIFLSQSALIKNNLAKFKEFIDANDKINDYATAIQYSYDLDLQVYEEGEDNKIVKLNPNPLTLKSEGDDIQMATMMNPLSPDGKMDDVFKELIDSESVLNTQYHVLSGKMPENYNEMVLVVNESGRIPASVLYALNIKDRSEFEDVKQKVVDGEEVKVEDVEYKYEDFVGKKYKLVLASDYYTKEGNIWVDNSENLSYVKNLVENGEEVEIVGILKVNSESTTSSVASAGFVGYTHKLTEHMISKANESEIVKAQLENQETNILTGISFNVDEYIDSLSSTELRKIVQERMAMQSSSAQMIGMILQMPDDDLRSMMKEQLKDSSSLKKNLQKMGYIDLSEPEMINIYPKDFESKEAIADIIEEYNQARRDAGEEESVITYTDYVGLMMSSITNIINIITYVLVAFVAISLVVSSIMIAIITYISVLERTKEIGILRSIGASKSDVSKVFNAETFIEGLIAGVLGIGVTLLLCMPINAVIEATLGVTGIASLPFVGGIWLIILSIFLTVIAGIIPSRMASKKDPAVALRS